MRLIKNICVFSLLFFLVASNAFAQTLEELVKQIDSENLQLKALDYMYQSSLHRGIQVSELPDPVASIGLFPFPVETRLGPQRLKVGATQMIPWKGVLDAKEELENIQAKTNYEKIDAAKLDLIYSLKNAYFQLYEKEKSMELLQRNLHIFRTLEQYALSKVESGRGSLADVLRVQIKITETEKRLEILKQQKVKPIAIINQILNRPGDSTIVVVGDLAEAFIPYQMDSLSMLIMSKHPVINSLNIQQEYAHKSIELNELNSKPSFGVGMDYIMVGRRSDADPSGNGRDIVIPRGSIRIPIFKKKYTAKEQEEKLKIVSLENQKLDVKNRFVSMIEQAFSDFKEAGIEIQLYQDLTKTTQSAIDILEADYSNSGRSFDELLRLQIDLVNYDLKILKSIVKSHVAKISIERFLML